MVKKPVRSRRKTLKRIKYFPDLKIDRPLNTMLRRSNVDLKKSRAGYIAYENQVFCTEAQRCGVAAYFHITCTN